MNTPHLISALAIAGVLTCAASSSASAATIASEAAVSANWSGYTASANANQRFSSVSGSWIEPAVDCTTGQGDSAFWVGLGGGGQQSQALEQVGTEADCRSGSAGSHFAWYELVPAAPVRLNLQISPGDHVSGRVTVVGTDITVSLSDETTGASATKQLQMSAPDTSTAEWIAEAPSSCDGSGNCQPLPLTNFGTVKFSNASATADGHTGAISDPSWTAQPVALSAAASGYNPAALVSSASTADAAPTTLSTDGSSFSVTASSGDSSSGSGADGSSSGYPGADGSTGNPDVGGYGYGNGPDGYGGAYGSGSAYGDGSGGMLG
jgi:Peptidase A4 family